MVMLTWFPEASIVRKSCVWAMTVPGAASEGSSALHGQPER